VFILKLQELKYIASKSHIEGEYAGKTYAKKSSFNLDNLRDALALSRRQLEQGIICLVVKSDTDISIWMFKEETILSIPLESQQKLVKILTETVGPIGKVLFERTLPQAKNLEDLIDQLSSKVPSGVQEDFRASIEKSFK
jgi:hypothetical protein